jgi:hypothetical protein
MSMTPRLHSLSAIASELRRDRRTIAGALSRVPPDGHINQKPAWFLSTAIQALRLPLAPEPETENGLLQRYERRLDEWREIRTAPVPDPATDVTIETAADWLGTRPEVILQWIRCGMPYAASGDKKSGEGFLIRIAWAIEWSTLVYGLCRADNNDTLLARLGLADDIRP